MEGETMRDRYIPALIMLIAGAITCIFDLYRKAELLPSLKRLLLVLIIFYIIGVIAREIIVKTIESKKDNETPNTNIKADDNPGIEAENTEVKNK